MARRARVSDQSAPNGGSKQRIEEVALDLFAAQGFRATSVKDLMLACGLTPGALYNHFPSKDDLLFSILWRAGEELTALVDAATTSADTDDPADQLFRLCEAFALFGVRHPKETKIANVDYVELTGENLKKEIDYRKANRRRFERILEEGIAQGVFALPKLDGKNDVKHAATALANVTLRLSEAQGPYPRGGHEALARFHAELALSMVRAR